jgi:tetratricopeptide (TPR) repeat protein
VGILEDDVQNYTSAEVWHRAAVNRQPDLDTLHNNLGYNLLLQDRAGEAAAEFRRAMELNPKSEIARNNLGVALAADPKEAVLQWQSISDPATAHSNMAAVFIERKRYSEARQEVKIALEFSPEHPAALANLKLLDELDLILAFATLAVLVWSGIELFTVRENPLDDRLEESQTHALLSTTSRGPRRRVGGGFFNSVLYIVSLAGGEEWIRDTEKELTQAGIRRKEATALFAIFQTLFFIAMLAGMLYLQWGNPLSAKFGGMVAAFLLGWLLPKHVLHRLVRRYRRRLLEALPDTVDLLGIVLGVN